MKDKIKQAFFIVLIIFLFIYLLLAIVKIDSTEGFKEVNTFAELKECEASEEDCFIASVEMKYEPSLLRYVHSIREIRSIVRTGKIKGRNESYSDRIIEETSNPLILTDGTANIEFTRLQDIPTRVETEVLRGEVTGRNMFGSYIKEIETKTHEYIDDFTKSVIYSTNRGYRMQRIRKSQ